MYNSVVIDLCEIGYIQLNYFGGICPCIFIASCPVKTTDI